MPHARQLREGTRFGPYAILDPLGEGATAAVFRARDANGHEVAVKIRPRGLPGADRRFLREFESLRTIRIPGVVQVHEAGLDDEYLWFSMDLVEGKPFVEAIREAEEGDARTQRTTALGRQLLEILDALHQAGFIHRDIKPSNVLVDRQSQVRLLDFGIASFFEERDTTRGSNQNQLLGTLPYMSPEQLAALPLTPATDVFATALMLHEGIAGSRDRPHNAFGWIAKTCMQSLDPLATLFREVPLGLSKVIEEMLDIDPHRRPSAKAAARALRMVEAGMDTMVWPEPAFADPGDWWEPLESAVTGDGGPRTWVLEGPTGSGRSRLTEQLKRLGALQGTWSLEVACRVDSVGGAVEDLVDALLRPTRHESWSHRVMRPHTALLRRVWPTLPLSGTRVMEEPPDPSEVADTVAQLVTAVSTHHPLVLIVRGAEQVDRLTSAVLVALARTEAVGLIVVHDKRWQTATSERMLHTLVAAGAGHMRMRTPSREAQQMICASLCPHQTPVAIQGSPLRAVEAGLARLARWRGIQFPVTTSAPWALALRDTPLPTDVLTRVAGKAAVDNPWTREDDYGWIIESSLARTSVLSGLDDLATHAAKLADAWEASERRADAEIATLRLMARDERGAWTPALKAARRAVSRGRYAEARRWLQVMGTLPQPTAATFELAALQAEVAHVTDPGAAPGQLLARADRLAESRAQTEWVQQLAAELALTEGTLRTALVTTLKLGSPDPERSAARQARALLTAARARLALKSPADATRELDRASTHLEQGGPLHLRVELLNLRADVALAEGRLNDARQRSRTALRLASEHGHLGGAARCSARLATVLRRLGRRRQAEDYARAAREAFQEAGNLRGHAEATLALATLATERSDAAIARPLLDQAVRRIRGLQLTHLLPRAMRIALELATVQADTAEAAVALATLDPATDEEAPAAIVRWWRHRGETDRALEVPRPTTAWGRALFHTQRGLALAAAGRPAGDEARLALELSRGGGYAEVATLAQLVLHTEGEALHDAMQAARRSLLAELHLGALAMEARGLSASGSGRARRHWESLRARARQLGYRPVIEEAEGWLEGAP